MRISDWSSDVCSADLKICLPWSVPQMQFHADMALDEAEPGVKAVRVGAARRRSELDQLAIARAALVDRPQDHPFAEALTAQVADDAHRLDQPAPASDEG